jgi:hypothetical protein
MCAWVCDGMVLRLFSVDLCRLMVFFAVVMYCVGSVVEFVFVWLVDCSVGAVDVLRVERV